MSTCWACGNTGRIRCLCPGPRHDDHDADAPCGKPCPVCDGHGGPPVLAPWDPDAPPVPWLDFTDISEHDPVPPTRTIRSGCRHGKQAALEAARQQAQARPVTPADLSYRPSEHQRNWLNEAVERARTDERKVCIIRPGELMRGGPLDEWPEPLGNRPAFAGSNWFRNLFHQRFEQRYMQRPPDPPESPT